MTVLTRPTVVLKSLHDRPIIERPLRSTQLTRLSPANALLTDFTRTQPQTISGSAPIGLAHELMRYGGIRLLLVVDAAQRLSGIINAQEVIGGHRITLAMQQYGIPREEVTVDMVQTTCQSLHAMALAHLERLTVGELIDTLKTFGDQHLLITDEEGDHPQRLRGIISATDIGRAMNVKIAQLPEARTFTEICHVVLGHEL